MPQDDGSSVPFDISVTALIPSVYEHIVLLIKQFEIEVLDTKFNYSVKYQGQVYAHDFDSDMRRQLQSEIEQFQRVLKRLRSFGRLTRSWGPSPRGCPKSPFPSRLGKASVGVNPWCHRGVFHSNAPHFGQLMR